MYFAILKKIILSFVLPCFLTSVNCTISMFGPFKKLTVMTSGMSFVEIYSRCKLHAVSYCKMNACSLLCTDGSKYYMPDYDAATATTVTANLTCWTTKIGVFSYKCIMK